MGNRFGRNKKRKLMQAIGVLAVENERLRKVASEQNNLISYFTDMDKEIAQMLGSASALRLITDKVRNDSGLVERSEIRLVNQPLYRMFDMEGLPADRSTAFRSIHNLKKMYAKVFEDPDNFRAYIKVIVGNETEAAMYVDQEYLMRTGLTNKDILYLSQSLTHSLAAFINKRYNSARMKNVSTLVEETE